MIFTIIICLIAVLFPVFNPKNGLKYSFILLAAFIGLRYNYGSDYMDYLNSYISSNSSWQEVFNSGNAKNEWLWGIIVRLSKPIGYFGLNIVISSFECWVLYRTIRQYVPQNWYWLAVFLYAFSFEFFLIGAASMLRQWLTICIFVTTVPLIKERKLLLFLLIIIAANFIHRSALILLPFFFLTYIQNININGLKIALLILILVLWWFWAPSFVFDKLTVFLSEDYDAGFYNRYLSSSSSILQLGIGILLKILAVFICLTQTKRFQDETLLFMLYGCSLLFIPLSGVSGLMGRFTMYFSVFSIFVIPMVAEKLKNNNNTLMYILVGSIMLVSVYDYYLAFGRDETWNIANYQTIFSTNWR